ncbi:hypothetical protein TRFO_09061 [Tritrichomonas foetus]|uniref:Uncharacterized protein n=1 Tax=Tritrichomonas foetus TaxID=1144522 RepID=A0A1J4JLN9_9EUKA|nr:hypothetical protein TRFO_09061 [Tritrichomonas foetus]|eukprot:OHS98188.1 hypothetical protein TRFO_09061 [Tritrichomonas foetus]
MSYNENCAVQSNQCPSDSMSKDSNVTIMCDESSTQRAHMITDFIARQFEANEKMQRIREEAEKSVNREHRVINDTDNARVQELYEMSLKQPEKEEVQEAPVVKSKISEKSIMLANAKNERQLNVIFMGYGKMSQQQFAALMRRFSIKSPELIESLKEYSRIDDETYSGSKLKNLMISSANKEFENRLAKKIQPYVTALLANSVNALTPKLKTGSISSLKTNQIPKTNAQKPMQKKELAQKPKTSRPKTAAKSGNKYLPDFYEHLELYDEQTPRYRSRHNYLAEKPKVWK